MSLLILLALIGAPAAVLAFACVGASCDEAVAVQPEVPFCTLPGSSRTLLEAGYYKGRSPEVFGFAAGPDSVAFGDGQKATGAAPAWPNEQQERATDVSLTLWGAGVVPGPIQGKPGLEDIAPTLAAIAGFDRGNPSVRSGTPIEGAWKKADPRLLVMIALKNTGTVPAGGVAGELAQEGASGLATTGSLPVDSAASLTTIGTGGPPMQHGITGSLIRNENDQLVAAWSERAPTAVIAALGDDLDEKTGQRSVVGLVATDPTDRGLIGGNWYLDGDTDEFRVADPGRVGETFADVLRKGEYGKDAIPDLLGATIDAPNRRTIDRQLEQVVSALREAGAVGPSPSMPTTVVLVGTGAADRPTPDMTGKQVASQIGSALSAPVVETAVPGGLFLDQEVMTSEAITTGRVMKALKTVTIPGTDRKAMRDAYPGFSVSFSRFCDA